MADYAVYQLTGTYCAPRNCAAASGAMGLWAGSGGQIRIDADDFRAEAGVSCTPGTHSGSGGLFIGDVERVFRDYDIRIDYGRSLTTYGSPARWPSSTLATKLRAGYGAVLLGDYDALPSAYRASGSFLGDHSTWVHDLRSDGTVCWHDPLRRGSIRIPLWAALRYWQKDGSVVRGFAGFVRTVAPATIPGPTGEDVIKIRTTLFTDSSGRPTSKRARGRNVTLYLPDGRRKVVADFDFPVIGRTTIDQSTGRAPKGAGWLECAPARPNTGYLVPASSVTLT